jgi:hypothetical protein
MVFTKSGKLICQAPLDMLSYGRAPLRA